MGDRGWQATAISGSYHLKAGFPQERQGPDARAGREESGRANCPIRVRRTRQLHPGRRLACAPSIQSTKLPEKIQTPAGPSWMMPWNRRFAVGPDLFSSIASFRSEHIQFHLRLSMSSPSNMEVEQHMETLLIRAYIAIATNGQI